MGRLFLPLLMVTLLLQSGICKPSNKDAELIKKDTGEYADVNSIMDEIDSAENYDANSDDKITEEAEKEEAIESGTYVESEKDEASERAEAIATGTYHESASEDEASEKAEAIASGTFQEAEDETSDKAEAIATGTYHESENSISNDDESWLPPKTSIAEEIAEINKVDGAKGLIDGDILPPQRSGDENDGNEKRNALRDRRYLWRSRVVPYYFDPNMPSHEQSFVKNVLTEYETKTCIRFKQVPSSSSEHKIRVFNGRGCYSYVGKTSGSQQDLSLAKNCVRKGIVIHEFMHALGFYHEQSRFDRDAYVRIDFSNVIKGFERNFEKKNIQKITGLGLPYDYDGVMHYGAYAFAKDKSKPTIIKLKTSGGSIGQRKGFSTIDLQQINALYDCKTDSTKNSWSSWSSWSSCFDLDQTGKKEHSQRFCFKDNLSLCPGSDRNGIQKRSRPCQSGPSSPRPSPVTNAPKPTPGGNICGTRSNSLDHPAMNPQNIVGGSNALPGDWPWQVGIARKGSIFIYCGGTLVSDKIVISAAHCFSRNSMPSGITARLGEHNKQSNEGTEQIITLSKIDIHPAYNSRGVNNDIAILTLSKPAKFTKYVRPACIPSASDVIPVGTGAFVSGWGTTSEGGSTSAILQVAKVPIISNAACLQKQNGITAQMLCAGHDRGGIDSCQGDSGGPLVYKRNDGRFYLGGIVSWGVGCARPGKPGVYARVSALRSFIDKFIGAPVPPVTQKPGTPSPDPLTCSFEKSLCNWQQATNDKFDWKRRRGRTPSSATGPSSGPNGPSDYYLYIETSYPRRLGDVASIVSPTITSNSPRCLTLKANMHGSSIGSLKINIIDSVSKTKREIFSKAGNQGNQWFSVKADIPSGSYQVEISGIRGSSFLGDIAIDEITMLSRSCNGAPITNMPPTTEPPAAGLLKCAFEKSLCNWQQDKNDNFDWTRRRGNTPSSSTGPSNGPNGPSDYYLYIETSYPRRLGDVAAIVSPNIVSKAPGCLKLKAHMYGNSIGSLRINLIDSVSKMKSEIFSKAGNQGKKWFSVNADLPSGSYQVEISGVRGSSYHGDIAIDEITMLSGSCNGDTKPPTTKPPTTKPPTTKPSTTKPSTTGLLKCAFEKSICNWQQDKNDIFDWTRSSGRTPSSSTGPSSGPNGGSDYYLFIETSYPRRLGDTASIISPNILSSSPGCLTLKAHMYGRTIGSLKINIIDSVSKMKREIFSKAGNQGNKWFSVNADLPSGSYQVEINGVRGGSYTGDIAIDDVNVLSRRCNKPTITPPSGSCGVPKIAATRVIAGKDVVRGSWPWQILMLFNGRPMCGGTLINPTTVVTAAHCVSGRETKASLFKVRVGEHNIKINEGSEVDMTVSKILSHPSYTRSTIDYDIAVMKLATPAKMGTYVGTACLPAAGQEPPVGSTCYITGFGKIKHPGNMHNLLQQASMKVVSQQTCASVNTANLRIPITDRMICGGNGPSQPQSGCHGDSGGPFVCKSNGKWYLQGAVSWGSGTCSASVGYTVFAKISNKNINDWIRKYA